MSKSEAGRYSGTKFCTPFSPTDKHQKPLRFRYLILRHNVSGCVIKMNNLFDTSNTIEYIILNISSA